MQQANSNPAQQQASRQPDIQTNQLTTSPAVLFAAATASKTRCAI